MLSTRQATYDYLTKFYAEIHELFPDKFVHVGGDEVCPTPTRAGARAGAGAGAGARADA